VTLFLTASLTGAFGCGKDDPNKNLKPIDANTPPPQPAADGKGNAEKPAPIAK
jgi:hypothetical protein